MKPTPHHIDSITTAEPSIASSSDSEDKPVKVNKCKNRCPTPLPGTLITFPTFSDTEDPDSATYHKLLPCQDHTRHIPRPPWIPVPTKQLLKPCTTENKQNKDTTCIPVPKDRKCIKDSHINKSTDLHMSNSPRTSSDQTTINSQLYLHKR